MGCSVFADDPGISQFGKVIIVIGFAKSPISGQQKKAYQSGSVIHEGNILHFFIHQPDGLVKNIGAAFNGKDQSSAPVVRGEIGFAEIVNVGTGDIQRQYLPVKLPGFVIDVLR